MAQVLYTEQVDLNFRQRWASYLTVLVTLVGLLGGYQLKSNTQNASQLFENKQVGIRARYPAGWLKEEGEGEFVFRVQDASAIPFKTSLQISLIPISPSTRPSDILDLLDLDRSGRLSAYRPLGRVQITLPNGKPATRMTYAYADVALNPFLQAEPIAVRAVDVLILRGGQAIVVSFQSETVTFDQNQRYFDTFLRTLEF